MTSSSYDPKEAPVPSSGWLRVTVRRQGVLVLALASLGLLSLGLPDGMLGVAWPSISGEFNVPLSALGVLVPAFAGGYITVALSSGRIAGRFGMHALLLAGTAFLAAGLLGFALSSRWETVLIAAWIGGMGGGCLDAGLNTVAALRLGVRATNWIHAFYGVGAATGPIVMTGLVLNGQPWQTGYMVAAAVVALLGAAFIVSRRTWSGAERDSGVASAPRTPAAPLPRGGIWLSVALFALCTGLEVAAGQWTFTLLTEGRGSSVGTAGAWVAAYFAGFTIGRIALGVLPIRLTARSLLRICMGGALAGALLLWWNPVPVLGHMGVAALGLFLGPVFPSLVATTRERVGLTRTASAVGFQMAAAGVGGIAVPAGAGLALATGGFEAIAASIFAAAAVLVVLHEMTGRSRLRSSRGLGAPA